MKFVRRLKNRALIENILVHYAVKCVHSIIDGVVNFECIAAGSRSRKLSPRASRMGVK